MEETGGGENDPACAEKGCFVKFVDLPRRSLFPPAALCPRRLFLVFFPFFFIYIYIYSERGSMTGARSIPRRFTAKRGSETRNTDGNLHS